MEQIFEPFFTTKAKGLGLGLSVCRTIIAAHRGKLWATNNADCGATFHFSLPIGVSDGEVLITTKERRSPVRRPVGVSNGDVALTHKGIS